jgi:hypothetical protein
MPAPGFVHRREIPAPVLAGFVFVATRREARTSHAIQANDAARE